MRLFKFVLLFLLFSCGEPVKKAEQTTTKDVRAELIEKYDLYYDLSLAHRDENGFIETDKCDSLLFTSLYGIIDSSINIEAAKNDDGRWFRRPLSKPCLINKDTDSTVSRDMFVGLLWFIWEHRRLDLAEELFNYGKQHNWVMGVGEATKLYFTPTLQATLAQIIYKFGGGSYPEKDLYDFTDQFWDKSVIGFEAHLQVLHILLRGQIVGKISTFSLDVLKYHYNRNKFNALFSYALHTYTDGNYQEAIQLLLNEQWFPASRLPTSKDRKESWLFQREFGVDWSPSNLESKEHSGADFLFLSHLILFK